MWPFVSFIHQKSLPFQERIQTDGGKDRTLIFRFNVKKPNAVVFIALCFKLRNGVALINICSNVRCVNTSSRCSVQQDPRASAGRWHCTTTLCPLEGAPSSCPVLRCNQPAGRQRCHSTRGHNVIGAELKISIFLEKFNNILVVCWSTVVY